MKKSISGNVKEKIFAPARRWQSHLTPPVFRLTLAIAILLLVALVAQASDVIVGGGKIGIGTTTTPANALDVGGDSSGAVRIDGRGAFFLAAEAACLASGPNDRFTVWSPGIAQTCTQACNAIVCGTAASCVMGWSLWSGTDHYRYGSECTDPDSSGGQGISGKVCCCTGTGCSMSMYK